MCPEATRQRLGSASPAVTSFVWGYCQAASQVCLKQLICRLLDQIRWIRELFFPDSGVIMVGHIVEVKMYA